MKTAAIIAAITATPFLLGLLSVAILFIDLKISGRDRWQDPPKSRSPHGWKSS